MRPPRGGYRPTGPSRKRRLRRTPEALVGGSGVAVAPPGPLGGRATNRCKQLQTGASTCSASKTHGGQH
eukprot:11515516-Alexandrium_andersonii.AAC.1